MSLTMSVKKLSCDAAAIRKAVKALTDKDVLIGIPEDKAARGEDEGKGMSNAALGYVHEHGSPAQGIPARPFLIPGIEDVRADAVELLEGAAKAALEGKPQAVETALNKIGLLGQNAVRAKFVDNDWPALSDKTLDAKALKKSDQGEALKDKKGNKLRKKSRREKGNINPLINTGQLRKSITYVVRKAGGS